MKRTQLSRFVCCLALSLSVAATSAGCVEDNPAFSDPTCGENAQLFVQTFAATHPDRVDILFVVDTTPGSEALRLALREAAPDIIEELEGLDYRIAVTPADSSGVLHVGGGRCGVSQYVEPSTDDPVQALRCVLDLPTSMNANGAGIESALTALDAGTNPNFMRREARLVPVFVSHVDDCSSRGAVQGLNECEWNRPSLTSTSSLASDLRKLKDDRNGIGIVTIVGPEDGRRVMFPEPATPSCTNGVATGYRGSRYHALGESFRHLWLNESSCTGDLRGSLRRAMSDIAHSAEARFCISQNVPEKLRDVELKTSKDDDTGQALPENVRGGYAFVGGTTDCPTGVVSIDAEARSTVLPTSVFDVFFCGE